MKNNYLLLITILIITFHHKRLEAPKYINLWVIWNVGQGLWVTHIESDYCHHFDFGGELGSFKQVKPSLLFHCARKVNTLWLSHWDYDHFLNLPALARNIPRLCWAYKPLLFQTKKQAQPILQLKIPPCHELLNANDNFRESVFIWSPTKSKTSNESSAVFKKNKFLMPGDSNSKMETEWSVQIPKIENIQYLLLGHHGSKNSTHMRLLSRLHQLRQAIATSRLAKYQHPHPITLNRLSQKKIPTLRTEVWGHIWITTN